MSSHGTDIAIVGMAGRFPGANTLEQFWQNLALGRETISFFSTQEAVARGVSSSLVNDPRFVRAAPVLDQIDQFDADFFGYHPREAELMDPQQRILIECAWEALEDAGYDGRAFDGLIGVYAGAGVNTYLLFNIMPSAEALDDLDQFQVNIGNTADFLATRISYKLNLKGPSLTVQTACSTSLVAVHLACQSLLNQECDMALAGGIAINVKQQGGYLYAEGGIVSPDGHCRAFDANAQGTVFGSGVGLVVLKRLDDALAAGDSIRAVIKGSAINNDGNLKVGYTAPSVDGQAEVIIEAQSLAGVHPDSISYIEAHGTGTALGDPIEVQALTKAFRAATSRSSFCALGSVKSNIGHLDAAAGIASLIKATLALQHQQLPPSLHVQQPNPACAFDTSPFYVNTSLAPWPAADHPRRAGVSSFGIGGTNAHLILEEAPPAPAPAPAAPAQVLLLSARSPAALDQLTQRLAAHLRAQPSLALADLAFTLHAGRRPLPVRRALLAPDHASALAALEQPAITVHSLPQGGRERGVALLLPGQSGTLPRLSPSLAAIAPVFQRELARCASLLRPLLARDLLALLAPHSSLPDPLPTALAQPAGFALAWALAQQWLAWGLHPQALLGHSLGELVAATLAQVFSLEDALALVVKRGQLMQQATPGQMLVVALDASTLRARLDPALDLAAVNGPQQCVIAGPAPAIQSCAAQFHSEGIQTHLLPGAHAFHSRALDAVVTPFAAAVAQVRRQPPQIAFLSNLSGTWITPAQATDPHYWGQHLRAPVLFQPALAELLNQGPWLLLEAGAGQALSGLARRAGADAVVPSLGGASGPVEGTTLLQAAGQVWQLGGALDPLALHGPGRRRIPLPTYPFQRQRFWIAPPQRPQPTPDADSMLKEPSPQREEAAMAQEQNETPAAHSARYERLLREVTLILGRLSGRAAETLAPQATFFEIGFDSLILLQVNQAIKDTYGVSVSLRQFFEDITTLATLATYLDQHLAPEAPPAVAASAPPPGATPHTNGVAAAPSPAPQVTVQPHASAPAPAELAPAPLVPRPALNAPGAASELERLIGQQIQLMAQQLELLRGQTAAPIVPAAPATPQVAPPTFAPAPASPAPQREVFVAYQPLRLQMQDGHSQRQRQHLAALIERYTKRTAGSKRTTQESRAVLANNRNMAGFRPDLKELIYPIIAAGTDGANIWDVDGNRYIDLTMGFGVYLFGYGAPFIARAIAEELGQGGSVGPVGPRATRVAAQIAELTGVERVAFFNSGTDAVMVALRVARAATGRPKVAIFAGAFHGTYDAILARAHMGAQTPRAVPLAPGIPESMIADVLVLNYDDPHAIELVAAHAHELAAVLVEPVQSRRPDLQPRAFLQQLRDVTARHGVALIFDEVITGFRIHPGGAQAWFGVQADLVTYGKIIGGGLPIGVVAGRATFMDSIDGGMWEFGDDSYPPRDQQRTFVAGTFCQHPLAMAAAEAVLARLKEAGPALQERLNARTASLAATLNAFFQSAGAPMQVVHFGSLFRFVLRGDLELFFYHMIEHGVYIWEGRNCFLSTAHTDADVERIIQAVQASVAELQRGGFLPEPAGGIPAVSLPALPSAPALPTSNGKEHSPVTPLHPAARRQERPQELEFSLVFFGDYQAAFTQDKYDLIMQGARFADAHGLSAVWVPERHFHAFGGFSPNPAVVAAALARETRHIQIRAGSVVLPLHHPIRVAEEWAMVDNLSQGRVGVSFASGWHANDFVLAPEVYGSHRERMFESIETVQRLWRGEKVTFRDGAGAAVPIALHPLPRQRQLPSWLTVVKNPDTYRRAGALGAAILTNLMDQSIEELAQNIALYRQELAAHGHGCGHVTVLLHTFLGEDLAAVRGQAREPFYGYLETFLGLAKNFARSQGLAIDLDQVAQEDVQHLQAMAYERYCASSALIGTVESAAQVLETLRAAGVDEAACFVDFGVAPEAVLASLQHLPTLRERCRQFVPAASHPPAPQELVIPLTEEQQQLWLLTQREEQEARAYNELVLIELRGPLHMPALRAALRGLAERHEALRTLINATGETQTVLPMLEPAIQEVDFSALDEPAREAQVKQWLVDEGQRLFDLATGPLFRVAVLRQAPDSHLLAMSMHHIIADDWSRGVLLQELAALYSAAVEGRRPELPAPVPFRAYIEWQAQQQHADLRAQADYWRAQCANLPALLELPNDYPRPPRPSYAGERVRLVLDTALCQGLRQASARQGTTLVITMLAAFQALLYRLTGQPDLIVGLPMAGQPLIGAATLVGQCITILPVRTQVRGGQPFAGHLGQVRRGLLDLHDHQSFSFALLRADDGGAIQPPTITVLFNMDRAVTVPSFAGLQAELRPYPIRSVKFELGLNILEIDGTLHLDLEYQSALFAPATVERWAAALEALLHQIVADPACLVADLALPNTPALPPPPAETDATPVDLLAGFAAQVAARPTAPAVIAGEETCDYQTLNQRANQLAQHLKELGVQTGASVALCLPASIDLVIGLLATLKLGASYRLIAPAEPAALSAALANNPPAFALVAGSPPELPAATQAVVLAAGASAPARRSKANISAAVAPQQIVCQAAGASVTAAPVAFPAALFLQHLRAYQQTLALDTDDRVLVTPHALGDAGLERILPALSSGAALVLDAIDPAGADAWAELRARGVTTIDLPVAAWGEFAHADRLPAPATEEHTLRRIILGGGLPLAGQIERWGQLRPAVQLLYALRSPAPPALGLIGALGQAAPGSALQRSAIRLPEAPPAPVLDGDRRMAALGVAGDLWVAVPPQTAGALGLPDMTTPRALVDTGLRARRLPSGELELLGTHIAYVRGAQVDLDELASILRLHPALSDAATIQDEDGQLIAFVVARGGGAPASAEVHSFLKERVSEAHLPAAWRQVARIPRHPSGEVDRVLLGTLPAEALVAPAWTAPRTATEQQVAQVWAEVLRVERVGLSDNFFELGGHSLLAIQLLERVAQAFQVTLPLQTLVVSPTVESMAVEIVRQQTTQVEQDALAEMLDELDQLSDDEVSALLGEA